MLIEIFKTGEHTDSSGARRVWTEADLDAIATKYNGQPEAQRHDAPVVIGHPTDNAPAYGWVERVERKGGVLYARLKDLAPEFMEWVKKGLYKKRSISLYPDMTLRHIGFLGAMPPAIKGLADVQFATAEGAVTIDFDEAGAINAIGYIFQRMRDWLIGKFGQDTADQVCDQYSIDALKTLPPDEPTDASLAPLFNEGTPPVPPSMRGDQGGGIKKGSKESGMEKQEFEAKASEFAEKIKERDEELAKIRAALEKERRDKRTAGFVAFCEQLIAEGRLTPAQRPVALGLLEIAHSAGDYEFAEGDKKPALDQLKAFLQAMPQQVEFGEKATKAKAPGAGQGQPAAAPGDYPGPVDEDRMALHAKALEYMEKHEGVNYMAAMKTVIKGA
jgi:hypothetical protein